MSKKIWNTWNEKQLQRMTITAVLMLTVVMILVDVFSYRKYRSNLIRTEQGQLLTMARIIGTSLDQYLEQELNSIDLCFADYGSHGSAVSDQDLRHRAEQFLNSAGNLYRGFTVLRNGERLFALGEIPDNMELAAEKTMDFSPGQEEGPSITGKYQADTGWYEMIIRLQTWTQGGQVSLLFAMDLNEVYQKIVAPVQIGRAGYSVVKDKDLAIIMHHAKNQIGMDALYDRELLYPDLDLTSLKEWLDMQRSQEEGTGILDSYVWDDPALQPVRRIAAYTTIDIQGEQWIVNSTIPIEELSGPLNHMLMIMASLTLLFLSLAVLIAVAATHTLTRSAAQKQEIEYLKEINHGMELVARKNEEIRHYQRVQSLGMMSSHIAHEFNNYLTPVMVYGEILEEDEEISEENRLMLTEMLKSVGQAAKLSRDLLDFSRSDTGGKYLPLNLTAEVSEALHVLKQLVPRKIHFFEEVSAEPAWILGREGMMQHILMNLGKNAFYAMEETETKELSVHYTVADGTAQLMISDTGCGIREENLRDVFEPFYTTKGSRQGTGLGLSVVRSLVENAGGQIRVESEVNHGTTFSMVFPVKPEPSLLQTERLVPVVKQGICVCRSRKSVSPWQKWLSGLDGRIEYTSQEIPVVARMQENTSFCDLLIIELELESMNGLELAQIVRRSNPDLRIVILALEMSEALQWNLDNRVIDQIELPSEYLAE